MADQHNVDEVLRDLGEGRVDEDMHPMQAIQAIQTALNSLESRIEGARLAYRDYGQGAHGSMSSQFSDEQLLAMLVKESEGMVRLANKIHTQAVNAQKAHASILPR